jgi:hypothetical protein
MGRVRHVWEGVRRHPVTVLGVTAIVASFLAVLLARLPVTSAPTPRFRFLAGQSPIRTMRGSGGWTGNRHDTYSLAGDVQSLCAAAQSELTALGYVVVARSPADYFPTREYRLAPGPSGEAITVRILSSARLRVFATPENSQYFSPDRYEYRREDGWVSVEVDEYRNPSWLQRHVTYPVQSLLSRRGLPRGK